MKKRNAYLLLFLLIFFLNTIFRTNQNSKKSAAATQPAEFAVVKKVIDGDTIELASGQKVRYIGIDTPEFNYSQKNSPCFGEEAKNSNQQLVAGKTVKLEKDISEADKYGRLLRYVFLPDLNHASSSGLFVNQYLVEEGDAYAAAFPPDIKYADLFRQKQQEAKINNKGLWKNCQN